MTKHLQKFTAVLLAAIMTLGVFAVVPFTASAATISNNSEISGGFPDQLYVNKTAKITNGFAYNILDNGTAEITDYIKITVKELTIPAEIDGYRVTSIGDDAFCNCENLKSITIPDSVTSIGDGAFSGTSWFDNQPDGIVYAGKVAYEYKGEMPENTSLIIKDGTKSIANQVFEDLSNLTSITIPDSVTYIGERAFHGTAWLDNQPDGIVYAGKVAYTYKGEMPENTSLIIKDGTKSIADYAFDYAFENCGSLTSVTIPDSVTYIGYRAFNGCTSLTSITIPDSVTSIGLWAFDGCTGLTNINVNKNNTNYSSINGVLFNKNKTELIAYPAGKSDKNYTIPNSVTSISDYAFFDCTSLTNIAIPDSVTSIGPWAFDGTAWFDNQPDGIVYAGKVAYSYKGEMPENTSLTIKDGTKSIADEAFYDFKNLTSDFKNLTSITIPDSVTSIGNYAFDGCSGLTSVTIPYSVTSIGGSAFSGCSNLTTITIPDSVTSIGNYAFSGCSGLTSVIIPNNVTSIGYFAFHECKNLTSINVNINNTNYSSVNGVLFNKNKTELITYPAGKSDKNYTIPNSVTTINHSAFRSCKNLTSVTIPDKSITIEIGVFSNCSGLTSVTIPNSVTFIGWSAFSFCENLKDITIPDGITSILSGTFYHCTSLKNISIPDSVTSIGSRAFEGCTSLKNLTIPNYVATIDYRTFSGCSSLTSITIPDSVTHIVHESFSDCTSLTNVTIPDSVTYIGFCAFDNCLSLTSITIPNSVISIISAAFGYDGGKKIDNFTITGYKGTAAEKYANENGFKFIALGDSTNPTVPTDPNNPDDPANPTPDNTSKPSLGDIDGDGKISVNDVTDIQKYIVQLKPFTDEQIKFADVDKNGKIDVNDVTLLQKVIVKIAVI